MPLSHCINIDACERNQLLVIARQSIAHGIANGQAFKPMLADYSENLNQPAAVFVTLLQDATLRGCIGSLTAAEPLALAVANSAHNAAFRDGRFKAVQAHELDALQIEVSILSSMQPIDATSRQQLLDSLIPGEDGLLLQDRNHRSTFLPKVWQQLPQPEDFLDRLMLKAGLKPGYWSASIRFQRYHTLLITES